MSAVHSAAACVVLTRARALAGGARGRDLEIQTAWPSRAPWRAERAMRRFDQLSNHHGRGFEPCGGH
eukprot:2526702-Rhodomonas_salina.1